MISKYKIYCEEIKYAYLGLSSCHISKAHWLLLTLIFSFFMGINFESLFVTIMDFWEIVVIPCTFMYLFTLTKNFNKV